MQRSAPARHAASRWGPSLVLVALAAVFLVRAASVARDQLVVPFSLGPAEFSNLETVQLIQAGGNPYAPEVYAAPPFVFSAYTPLYHYLVALFPMPDANPFFWGRMLAAAAMLLAGLLPLLVGGRAARPVSWVAVGIFFSLAPVVARAVLVRNDSLGLLLSALSVWMVHRADGRTLRVVAAAGVAILAVSAKQSLVAAPAACALYLLVADRKAFYRYAGAGLGLAAVAAVGAQLGFGSGFWLSTLRGPRQPIVLAQALHVVRLLLAEPLALALLATGLLLVLRESLARGRAAWTGSPYPLYVLSSSLLAVLTVGKAGSSTNYFVEPMLAVLLWISYRARELPQRYREGPAPALLAAGLVAVGAFELLLVPRPAYPWADPRQAEQVERQLERLRADVEALGFEHPRVLGLADHPGLYRESDRVQLSYPDLYYWLWHAGVLDIADMTGSIAHHAFDVIVVPRQWVATRRGLAILLWGQPTIRMEEPGTLLAAVRESYRVAGGSAAALYFVPRGSAGAGRD